MKETEFLGKLNKALDSLPADQREDIMVEYRSHFFEGTKRGKSEEAIAASFGDPRTIAQAYRADYHFAQIQSPAQGQGVGQSAYHLVRGIFVIFSLLFFNFFFMLWPILGWAIMLLTGWVVVASVGIFSVGMIFVSMIGSLGTFVLKNSYGQLSLFFTSVGCTLACALVSVLLYYISRLTIIGILRYIKLNVNLVAS